MDQYALGISEKESFWSKEACWTTWHWDHYYKKPPEQPDSIAEEYLLTHLTQTEISKIEESEFEPVIYWYDYINSNYTCN